ncbi:uncharacterized protein LOC106883999 [Octopus bimaculoides]|uniref:Uncharacterized protein n=1 Tax=Octopus bimaculoides TaxID=37653 RepID=A0A0L8I6T0_OCTBM|nr:uncharacterized protein LOC106883999 [Octopus bimaculoides]XP_014790657.1 uncharacterized protein LOC106883999 [Octopus bimaculoides]XP_014790658.1 uncharacterized protein LOC106883999 [Octopus bimaculoides]XP_014790659.1 uncharacterized protein LOC106883999 [Octopus bimaculoides]XP_052834413.1 uncharacterized protein LOC106883999 [Octopus bimaculoides]XP_052834414.1 uncharacterized protein LOC106883999 [Octopus bimaculoides]|eukprot:XP_014790656.1 PREDICTED: uncharacterized protein LOC106883999 [Octopus bimaculoides]
MESHWTVWNTDFHSDNFVNELNPGDPIYSIDDPIATNCSFGRKKRREEMTIPKLPKCFIKPPKNNSTIGRGLSKSSTTVPSVAKPGQLSFQQSHKVSDEVLHEQQTKCHQPLRCTKSENLQNLTRHQKKDSIIFDQNSFNTLNITCINEVEENDNSKEIDICNDNDFPELISSNGSENNITKRTRKPRCSKK